MINVHTEQLISFSQSTMLPTKPSRNTLAYWCNTGVKNKRTGQIVSLESVQIGGQWFTSMEAYDRWQERLNAGRDE